MGFLRTFLFLLFTIGSAYLGYTFYDTVLTDHPIPVIKDEFWGPGSRPGVIPKEKEDETIKPFKIDFTSPSMLNELKSKLKSELSGFIPPLEGIGFEYGFNTNYLKKVVKYWLEKYDFVQREKHLNRYPSFKTKIGGLDIHFQHVKPKPETNKKYKKTVPIIFLHGWPGSFVEYGKLVDYFLEPKNSDINFEIVIPSLPGFGYSQASSRPGMTTLKIANIFGRLMKRLGYDKFYAIGEDYGSMIVSDLMILYPDRVKGIHLECYSFHPWDLLIQNIASALLPSHAIPNQRMRERMTPSSKMLSYSLRETGYFHIQSTKPDTVGVGLTNSPSGGLTHKFTMDELLDNVMVYVTSRSITTSMRLYKETFTVWGTLRVPVLGPVSCHSTPEDVVVVGSEICIKAKFPNLKQFSSPNQGGHFAAFEVPSIVAHEAIPFFNNVEYDRYK